MNNKGFTLIEVLAVIAVLLVIFLLVFPNVNKILDMSAETTEELQIDKILDAAYDYSLKNTVILPESGITTYITLNELKLYGFVDSDITSPLTNEEYPNDLVISIKNVGGNYKYKNKYSKLSGNYLYTIEYELMNDSEYDSYRPTIEVDGYESETIFLNAGDVFEEPTYIATSSAGMDLSERVIKNIILNSKNVNAIDSTKANVYYINYTVVDDFGYSNEFVVSIVIADKEPPIFKTEIDNVVLELSDEAFDLYENIECEDNSGVCEIEVKGEIKFGESGINEIKYIAKDPTGNTTTKTRIIRIN